VQISLIVRSGNWERTEVSPAAIAYWPGEPSNRDRSRRPALPLSRLSNRRALEEHDMEQLISRRLPARRAQSGVALIMVLIMLTAMAIAGVALVRVVDSANVISGNFAFRQSTLNIADLGVEAATADLIAIHAGPAAARENAWPVGCEAPGPPDCRYFPVRSINLPNLNCNNAPFPQGCGLDGKGLPVRGNTTAITDPPLQDINWDGNDPNNNVPAAPRGYTHSLRHRPAV
jgi:hypothetical protein